MIQIICYSIINETLEKNFQINKKIEQFTVGRDREMDLYLAEHDVIGSIAHIIMLESIGLLKTDELQSLLAELRKIYTEIKAGNFVIEDGIEDVHSQIELMLTRSLGDIGKKIHSGRSRNDQVLVDIKLFTRRQLKLVAEDVPEAGCEVGVGGMWDRWRRGVGVGRGIDRDLW